jgi:hypothetical protein
VVQLVEVQAGRSRVRFPMVKLEFFMDLILTATLQSIQSLTEMSTRADNLTTFTCRLSGNLGASTFWNPKGPSSD